jgi:glucose/arabinose dehydrogenase
MRSIVFGSTLLTLGASAKAATLPAGFTETLIATGINNPTAMAFAPDGRLFVCEQGGRLRVIKNGALLATPFVTINVNSAGERGLLGVAFDPDFATNRFVYVYFTTSGSPIRNRISRFVANGDVAQTGSETVLFNLDPLTATNHNGGAIHFGPDGKLYVAVGENANPALAQSFTSVLGKMLRLNPNGSIPSDNPFLAQTSGKNRAIWAMGLRNPFTFAFQRGTGRMFINDVGQGSWEEINDGIAGSNYGWPSTEGETTNPLYRSPLYAYGHGSGSTTGCAITGGTFFDPGASWWPAEFDGDYFFADYCSGWIRRYDPSSDTAQNFASGISSPVDLIHRPDGLYYLARGGGGAVYRIDYTAIQAPQITSDPQDLTRAIGQSATFVVEASGAPPLSYRWQRNGVNISGATGTSYTLPSVQLADNGARFRCIVTNSAGNAQSQEAVLTVTTDQPPLATITVPKTDATYIAGKTYNFRGTGTDPETGELPASAFTWRIDLHHDTHTHPFLLPTSGIKRGSFTIPTTGETSANVFYRIWLTVLDPAGIATTTSFNFLPRTTTVTIKTQPAGLAVTLDGQPITTPFSFLGVKGITRRLGVVTPQTVGGTTYDFVSWSDGGAATHDIVTGAKQTYTATFQARP